MKPKNLITAFVFVTLLCVSPIPAQDEPSWHTSYSYDNGGFWRTRIAVDVENLGETPLENELVKIVISSNFLTFGDPCRVFHEDGRELVFGFTQQPNPEAEDEDCDCYGTLPDAVLFVPFEAQPKEKVRYYVYFDNSRMNSPKSPLIPEQKMLFYRSGEEEDDFQEPPQKDSLRVTVHEFEECPLKILPHSSEFMLFLNAEEATFPEGYECRSTFRIANPTEKTLVKPKVLFDLSSSTAHGRAGVPAKLVVVCGEGKFLRGELVDIEKRLVFATLEDLPPQSILYVHVYYEFDETPQSPVAVQQNAMIVTPIDIESFSPSPFPGKDVQESLTVWQIPSVEKAFPQSLPPKDAARTLGASVSRGEKASVQVLVRHYPLGEPTLKISPLRDEKGNTLPEPEIFVQKFILAENQPGLIAGELIPDDTLKRETTNARATNAFHVLWSLPNDAFPGTYRGTISFTGKVPAKAKLPSLPIEVRVKE